MALLDKIPEDRESDGDESSDIAESTDVSEEDEDSSEEGSNGEEDSDENEDDGDAEQLSSASSDDTEYDSSDVWSEEEDDTEKETKEATEAAIINDFERSLDLILTGKQDKAKKILKKILKQSSVAKYKTSEFLWENDATDNSHLNKMGRVFVGAHKNLATIDEENAIQHYLQVVALAPHNDDIWFSLGQKLVEKGDIDMAIYSFEQTNDWRAEEALMSTHYLKKNYKSCLQFVAAREERLGCFNKGDFLKNKIASMSVEWSEYVYQLFGNTSFHVDHKYEKEISSRLSAVEAKILQCMDESKDEGKEQRMLPIKISLSADQSVWNIMTVFCDLFDRIQAYSEVFSQRIFIEEWECRDDRLAVENAVMEMVEDVFQVEATVERIVEETAMEVGHCTRGIANIGRGRIKKGMEGQMKRNERRHRDGEKERIEESSCDEDERPSSVQSSALTEPTSLEDAETFYLKDGSIRPLREGMSQLSSRAATPGAIGSEEDLLTLIRECFYDERYLTVFKALETCLYSTLTMDCIAPRHSEESKVLIQVYRRWTQCCSNLLEPHQLSIHAFMVMYDERVAMEYCMKVVNTNIEQPDESKVIKFPEKRDLIRFVYKRWKTISGNEDESMKWLKFMIETIGEDEAFNVVGGVVSRDSMTEIVEKKERAERIRSLKHLSTTNKWDQIISIIENDSQWSAIEDDDELSVRTRIYAKSLINLGREKEAGEIINRMLFHLLSKDSLPGDIIEPWIKLLNSIKYDNIIDNKPEMLPSLGYSLLRLTEHTHLAKDWKLWRVLHQVIKRIEKSRPVLLDKLFEDSLEKDYTRPDDYDEMPFRSLRFLAHAHDRMAMNGVCGQKNGAFLKYSLSQFLEAMDTEGVKDKLWRKLQWLMNNVQEEIYQLLHCAFGKYSKKKRSAEDHESGVELGEKKRRITKCAIALSVPNPLPEFDDKGGVGTDLIDLVNNRFPSFIELNERRKDNVVELKRWIVGGPVCGGELEEGNTKEEKMRRHLVEWPHNGNDSLLASKVFYLFCLYYHRQSKTAEARQFAEYFLSSKHVNSFGNAITRGAWIILSYATVERMFTLYDDDLLLEFPHHIRPLRVAIQLSTKEDEMETCINKPDATPFFLLANALYQVATRLTRYFRKLKVFDPHQRYSIVDDVRREAVSLFEKVIEIASPSRESNQTAWEYPWLSYFFLAKLHLKGDNPDVVKSMENMLEAACALHMEGTVYLQKISVKNQKNIEPVEVHYQAYSTVWKYVTRSDNPPLEVLIRLRSYTDAFSKHGVVKPSAAIQLFEIEPAVFESVLNLTLKCCRNEKETDEELILNNTLSKVELIEELKTCCKEAFKLVVDRFPHRKAYHRLAEIALREGDLHSAHTIIFKKIFARKKKEDDIFEGVVEFASNDIERSDSLTFHVTRSLRLGLALSIKLGDAASIMGVCSALARTIINDEELYVLKASYLSMLRMGTRALSLVLSSHPLQWSKTVKTEILTLHKSLVEVNTILPLVYLRDEVKKIINKHGGIARLEAEVAMNERKPSQQRKRKAEDRMSTTDKMYDRLGLSSRPLPPQMNCTPIAPRPPTTPSSQSNQQSVMTTFNRIPSFDSSPNRSALPLPSTLTSPIVDPNRILHMLIDQSNSANANLFANHFSRK